MAAIDPCSGAWLATTFLDQYIYHICPIGEKFAQRTWQEITGACYFELWASGSFPRVLNASVGLFICRMKIKKGMKKIGRPKVSECRFFLQPLFLTKSYFSALFTNHFLLIITAWGSLCNLPTVSCFISESRSTLLKGAWTIWSTGRRTSPSIGGWISSGSRSKGT